MDVLQLITKSKKDCLPLFAFFGISVHRGCFLLDYVVDILQDLMYMFETLALV